MTADPDPRVGDAVAQLAAAVRAGQDGTRLLDQVCAHARTLTGARTVSVLTAEPDGELVVRATAGQAAAWRQGTRVPAVDTLASKAVRERVPVAAQVRGSRYRHDRALAIAGVRRVLYLPVPTYGRVGAILGVGYRAGAAVPAYELGLLEPMAVVAGLVPAMNGIDCASAEEQAAVGERERLARDLHDSVEQTLYGISLGAATASELLRHDPAQADRPIAWIQETAVAGLTDLRGLLLRLRPQVLAGGGLTAALVRLLETLQGLPGFRTIADLGPEPVATEEVKQALYRIAQEALQNVAKHAQATQVTLRLAGDGTTVQLEIVDDGRGFVPEAGFPGRLGLRSMRERAQAAGGRLEIVSRPAGGTVVRAVLPVFG
jgi:signal transduction histidine kinase